MASPQDVEAPVTEKKVAVVSDQSDTTSEANGETDLGENQPARVLHRLCLDVVGRPLVS